METRCQLANDIVIEGKKIGSGHPVFIIAEIGVNHNGDKKTAKKMIEVAARCSADCVKFQTFRAEEFMADRNMVYEYEGCENIISENMFEMFKRLELPHGWHAELFDYARERGLIPLTSVADSESTDLVDRLGVSAFKLSSEDFINLPLLEYVASKGKPLLLSTGMADEDEIEEVLRILTRHELREAVFLHCTSVYPTSESEVNLLRVEALRKKTGGAVGYSDHSLGIEAILGAVALGACVIEKHFTLDRSMPGPDHAFSADPKELKNLVQSVRRMETMLGSDKLVPSPSEIEMRGQFRRSIVAAKDLPAGHILKRDDLVLKRPGTGLKANEIPQLIGKRTVRDISKDGQIKRDSVHW